MADTPSKLGKSYRGQTFVPVKNEDDIKAEETAQVPYDKPDAVSLDVYFAVKGIRNPVEQAGMRAYTSVRRATHDDWSAIFATY